MNSEHIFHTFILLLARILMASVFILAALIKIMDFNHTAILMSSMSLPISELLLGIGIFLELTGGLLLLLGWYTRLGTVLLLIFVILVTYYFHSFWDYQGTLLINNAHHFFKNIFIFGALIYVFVRGPGRFSIDCCWRSSKD